MNVRGVSMTTAARAIHEGLGLEFSAERLGPLIT
jgi:hypothetical protein